MHTHICAGQKAGSHGRKGLTDLWKWLQDPLCGEKGFHSSTLMRRGKGISCADAFTCDVCVCVMYEPAGAGIVVARERGVINSTAHEGEREVSWASAFFDEEPQDAKPVFSPSLLLNPLYHAYILTTLYSIYLCTPKHQQNSLKLQSFSSRKTDKILMTIYCPIRSNHVPISYTTCKPWICFTPS